MKRGGGADVFLRSIAKMRRTVPDLTLRTSFIVGFPGETEKEFEELCDFVREAQFDWMGAFAYSDQEGAGAYALEEKLSPREIERRRKHLMGIQRQISKKKKKALVGREFDLLLEGESEETELLLEGRTAMHAPEIDGKVFVNDFPEETTRSPASSIAAKSPKRTITIWWQKSYQGRAGARFFNLKSDNLPSAICFYNKNIHAAQAHRQTPLPDLQKDRKKHRPGLPFLQRPLPPHRSGQVGQRRLRNFVSGHRRRRSHQRPQPGRRRGRIVKPDSSAGARSGRSGGVPPRRPALGNADRDFLRNRPPASRPWHLGLGRHCAALGRTRIRITTRSPNPGCLSPWRCWSRSSASPLPPASPGQQRAKIRSLWLSTRSPGQLIALIAVPLAWKTFLAGFILFRAFDIVKPPPVRQLEKLPEGTGIVLDDVAAGIFALVVMHLLLHFGLLR